MRPEPGAACQSWKWSWKPAHVPGDVTFSVTRPPSQKSTAMPVKPPGAAFTQQPGWLFAEVDGVEPPGQLTLP